MLSGLLSPPYLYLFLLFYLFPLFIPLQPQRPPCCFLKFFSAHSCLKAFAWNTLPLDIHKSYTCFMSLFKCHFLRETSLIIKTASFHSLSPLLYFLFLCSTSHSQTDIYFFAYFSLICFLYWTVSSLRTRILSVLIAVSPVPEMLPGI